MQFRTFLINDKRDENGLKVDWDVIQDQAWRWVGLPGVLDCDSGVCTHTGGRTLQEDQALSEKHAVSRIVDVELDESSHTAYAIHEPLKPGLICEKAPEYVSQALWLDEPQPAGNIHVTSDTGFTPVHVAFVASPAYSRDVATADKGFCTGRHITSDMDDSEKKDDSEKVMSNDDMIKAMYSMMMAKEEKEKAAESMGDHEDKRVVSSVKRAYPPDEKQQTSRKLADLIPAA